MRVQRTVTILGGTGFLGHAIVQLLAEQGYLVRVPTRDVEKAKSLKLMGEVGQVTPFRANLRTEKAITECLSGSDIVINLIGIMAENKRQNFQHIHVETAARFARIARGAGVKQFVHISALGAKAHSTSRYARTKAMGEDAVLAFFPDAIVLRPSVMFGPRDTFFNRFALLARFLPFLTLVGGGETRFQPVYVGDVAHFVALSLARPDARGRIFELGGPKVYSLRELMQLLLSVMSRRCALVPVSWKTAWFLALFFELFPDPPLTRDEIEFLKTDNVIERPNNRTDKNRDTMVSLGLIPTPLEDILPSYIVR